MSMILLGQHWSYIQYVLVWHINKTRFVHQSSQYFFLAGLQSYNHNLKVHTTYMYTLFGKQLEEQAQTHYQWCAYLKIVIFLTLYSTLQQTVYIVIEVVEPDTNTQLVVVISFIPTGSIVMRTSLVLQWYRWPQQSHYTNMIITGPFTNWLCVVSDVM